MYDYKKDDEQLSDENKTGTFVAEGNISSDFKVQKENLPQWAVDWARNRFNMDAKGVKFYVMDRQEAEDSVALASGNSVFVTSDQRNDETVIKHELTHIYQQAIGTATESNASDTSLEDEAVQVSKEDNISLAKNQTLSDRYILPREKTNVVQSLGSLAIAGLVIGGILTLGLLPFGVWIAKKIRDIRIANQPQNTDKDKNGENIKVDDKTTEIDKEAFKDFSKLKSTDLPNVTEIGPDVFCDCNNLEEIELPNVTKIGPGAFRDCKTLRSVKLPNVTEIGEGAFKGCETLSEVDLPNVTEIGPDVFRGCETLSSVKLPNVTKIGPSAFSGCKTLSRVDLSNVTEIGLGAFSGCKILSSVKLPNVTKIDPGVFSDCETLSSVNMPNVMEIGENAFSGCKTLSSVNMPNVTKIGPGAFWSCWGLSEVNLSKVTEIGPVAFRGCKILSSVKLPNVTKIGRGAFNQCLDLKEVDMPGVTEIGEGTFFNCMNLESINMPNVTEIGKDAFCFCKTLSGVDLSKVTEIGKNAFWGCTSLQEVKLPCYCNYSENVFPSDCMVKSEEMPDISTIDKFTLMRLYINKKIKPDHSLNSSNSKLIEANNCLLLIDALYNKKVKLSDLILKSKIESKDLLTRDKYGFDIYDAYDKQWINRKEIDDHFSEYNIYSEMDKDKDAKFYKEHGIIFEETFKNNLNSFEKLSKMPEDAISKFSDNYRMQPELLNGMRSGIYMYSQDNTEKSEILTEIMTYIYNSRKTDIKLLRGFRGYEAMDFMANMPIGSFEKKPDCIVGKEIFDRSFTSTTFNEKISNKYAGIDSDKEKDRVAVLLKITVPKGRKLNMMPISNENDEVVFNKFQKLKVKKVTKKAQAAKKIIIVDCEAVEDKEDLCKTEKEVYESSEFKRYQEEFEVDLGRYLYNSDEAYKAVQKGIETIRKNSRKGLKETFFSNKKYTVASFSGNVTEPGGGDLTDEEINAILKDGRPTDKDLRSNSTTVTGNLREKLAAFQFAVDVDESVKQDQIQKSSKLEPYICRRDRTKDDQEKLRRDFDYQDTELQLFRSARERRYQEKIKQARIEELGIDDDKSPITYGGMLFQPQYEGRDIKSFFGKRLVAGTSGTTMRLLNKYREQVSPDKTDLLNFRLVLMACMLPEKNHSLYEILEGSHAMRVRGYENLSTADTMDKTIDPLGEDKVRKKVCKGRKFPYERALNDYKKKNKH